MKQISRYNSAKDNPVDFDRKALVYLYGKYGQTINSAVKKLKKLNYQFESMKKFHNDSMDKELIFRQTIPMCIANKVFFKNKKDISGLIKSFCLCKTLITNNIDTHLDHCEYETSHRYRYLSKSFEYAVCFSFASLSQGILSALELKNSEKILSAIFKTLLFLAQSANQDVLSRYNYKLLSQAEKEIKIYNNSAYSRWFGSGFYEAGILSVFGFYDKKPGEQFLNLIKEMRKLRQMCDEIADVKFDLLTGLATYPVFLLIRANPEIRKNITELWEISGSHLTSDRDPNTFEKRLKKDKRVLEIFGNVFTNLLEYKIFDKVYNEAMNTAGNCRKIILRLDSGKYFDFLVLIDLKIAYLDRLKMYNWNDIKPAIKFFEDLR